MLLTSVFRKFDVLKLVILVTPIAFTSLVHAESIEELETKKVSRAVAALRKGGKMKRLITFTIVLFSLSLLLRV